MSITIDFDAKASLNKTSSDPVALAASKAALAASQGALAASQAVLATS